MLLEGRDVHDKGLTFKKWGSYFWKRGFHKKGVYVNPIWINASYGSW